MTYGAVYTNPNEITYELRCKLCDDVMDVKRNVNGPISFGMSMAGKSRLHDAFYCPNRDEMWHKQVYKLQEAARATPSKQIEDIIMAEANNVLKSRISTKTVLL